MRIDELDPKHKEFKKVILDHELTEEQLDEILPAVAAVGAGLARGAMAVGGLAARGAMAAGGALARGAGAVARGVGSAATSLARGAGNMARGAGQQVKQTAKDQINKKVKSFAQDTANKLANQGNQAGGGQTIGQDNAQAPQAQLARGSELNVPLADPKKPNQTKMTPMKVKKVSGQDIELEPAKKAPGQPSTLKFDKKDLAF